MDPRTFDQIGRLALELGWVGDDQLNQSLRESREIGIPVGLVLTNKRHLTTNELRALIVAQSAVRDKVLDPTIAIMALTIVGWSGVSMHTSLMFFGVNAPYEIETVNKLGNLLVDSGCVSNNHLSSALRSSMATGLPLGQTLLLRQLITHSCLATALEVQDLVRKEVVEQEEAVRSLQLAFSVPLNLAQAKLTLPPLPELRLGELLVLADVVGRDDVKSALEVAQTNKRRLGETLSIFAVVPASSLSTALELQRMLKRGEVSIDESISALAQAHRKGVPISVAISNARRNKLAASKNLSIAEFLKAVGLLTDQDITELVDRTQDNTNMLAAMLPHGFAADHFVMRTAARLKYLANAKVLTLDAACFAFHHCMQQRQDVDEFLSASGWYQPVEPGSDVYTSRCGNLVVV